MALVGVFYLVFETSILADFSGIVRADDSPNHLARGLVGTQIGLIVLSMLVTRSSALSLQAKNGLPRGNQIVGWLVLGTIHVSCPGPAVLMLCPVVSLGMPLAYRARPNNHYLHRLMVVFLSYAPTFVILTISYEGLFYVTFCATLVAWVRLEHATSVFTSGSASSKRSNGSASGVPLSAFRPLSLQDARVALFFFVLLQSAFFSTGNVASVSSFSLESVTRLLPVFDPFSQSALLIVKLMIPFALISANLGILNKRLGVAPSALFMVVMAISDVLTLYFFWVVKDEGSWLEIGSTISHFVIASLLCIFLAVLEGVSEFFIAGVEVNNHHRPVNGKPGNGKAVVAAPGRSNGTAAPSSRKD